MYNRQVFICLYHAGCHQVSRADFKADNLRPPITAPNWFSLRGVIDAVFEYYVYQLPGLGIPKPPKCIIIGTFWAVQSTPTQRYDGGDCFKELRKMSSNFVYW